MFASETTGNVITIQPAVDVIISTQYTVPANIYNIILMSSKHLRLEAGHSQRRETTLFSSVTPAAISQEQMLNTGLLIEN